LWLFLYPISTTHLPYFLFKIRGKKPCSLVIQVRTISKTAIWNIQGFMKIDKMNIGIAGQLAY